MPSATHIRVRSSVGILDANTRRMLRGGRTYEIRADRAGWGGYVSPDVARQLVEARQADYQPLPVIPEPVEHEIAASVPADDAPARPRRRRALDTSEDLST